MSQYFEIPQPAKIQYVDPVIAMATQDHRYDGPAQPKCDARGCKEIADGVTEHRRFENLNAKAPESEILPPGVVAGGSSAIGKLAERRVYNTCQKHRHASRSEFPG